ncbi:MAG: hypothetical protein EXS36_02420 [Pedosphaera sp.]|nr:hypothetical protein [Pedosphaera sp.]
MIILNLFIGIIMNSMADARAEQELAENAALDFASGEGAALACLDVAARELGSLQIVLADLRNELQSTRRLASGKTNSPCQPKHSVRKQGHLPTVGTLGSGRIVTIALLVLGVAWFGFASVHVLEPRYNRHSVRQYCPGGPPPICHPAKGTVLSPQFSSVRIPHSDIRIEIGGDESTPIGRERHRVQVAGSEKDAGAIAFFQAWRFRKGEWRVVNFCA